MNVYGKAEEFLKEFKKRHKEASPIKSFFGMCGLKDVKGGYTMGIKHGLNYTSDLAVNKISELRKENEELSKVILTKENEYSDLKIVNKNLSENIDLLVDKHNSEVDILNTKQSKRLKDKDAKIAQLEKRIEELRGDVRSLNTTIANKVESHKKELRDVLKECSDSLLKVGSKKDLTNPNDKKVREEMTFELAEKIRADRDKGLRISDLVTKYKHSKSAISRIINNKSYTK